ncbi:MAG: PilZ domain-containing protein, partial [bacterium]
MDNSEQRKHIRIALGDIVEYNSPSESFKTRVLDISYKGMQLESTIPFVSGKDATVILSPPHLNYSLRIPCRFLHGRKNSPESLTGVFAIEFVHHNQEQKRVIENFVKMMKEKAITQNFETEESRESPRIDCIITPNKKRLGKLTVKSIENISQKGLFLRFEGNILISSKIPLKFSLPNDKRAIDAKGKIVYITDLEHNGKGDIKGAGISFDSISVTDKQRIENFVLRQVSNLSFRKFHQSIYQSDDKNGFSFIDKEKIRSIVLNAVQDKLFANILLEKSLRSCQAQFAELHSSFFSVYRPQDLADCIIIPKEIAYFSFNYGRGSFYFQCPVVQSTDNSIVFQIPEIINHSEKRSIDRDVLKNPEPIIVEIAALQQSDAQIVKGEVIDVSSTGFSFKVQESPINRQIFAPGVSIQKITQKPIILNGMYDSGEVKHISSFKSETNGNFIKVGVETGINRKECLFRSITAQEWESESFFDSSLSKNSAKAGHLDEKSFVKQLIKFKNKKGQDIVAFIDATRLRVKAPVIVLPPAFGKKKETVSPLVLTLLANFKAVGKDLVIVRYDGINRPGESFKDERYNRKGWEMLDYTMTQGTEDLLTVLEHCDNNPYFNPSDKIIISCSLSSLKARKILSSGKDLKVGYWLNLMGIADGQAAFRNISGGLDIVGNYRMGVFNGISAILGHLVDLDKIAKDMVEHNYAFISDARKEFAKIKTPLSWIYGKYDSWINHPDIKDVMTIDSGGSRELIEIPTGHNLRTSKDAFKAFRIITYNIYCYLFNEPIYPQEPNQDTIIKVLSEERERIAHKEEIDLYDYWRTYLLGSNEQSFGYDFLKNLREFRDFLTFQESLLNINDAQTVADLGCGTGIFMENYLNNFIKNRKKFKVLPKLVLVDFIKEALDKANLKYLNYKRRVANGLPQVEFKNVNLAVNRLLPVKRFIDGKYSSFSELKNRIEGFPCVVIDKICKKYNLNLEKILKGKLVNKNDIARLKRRFSQNEIEYILEFNRASRFILRRLRKDDFEKLSLAQQFKRKKYRNVKTSDLIFNKLKFYDSDLSMKLPFKDKSFDKILAGLLISYLLNPDENLSEFHRILKPGGKIVVSTMKPDADISTIFTQYIDKVKRSDLEDTEIKDKEENLAGARSMLNEVASLFE